MTEDTDDGKGGLDSALTRLQRSRKLLAPAREILDRFNYKHKNQHRLSKWWASFDSLRRHVAKLDRDEIQQAVPKLELAARRAAARVAVSKRQNAVDLRDRCTDQIMPTQIQAKAMWLSNYLIPKAYLAFSQLAADNQFAHLGLLLLGVLAQVHTATSLILVLGSETTEGEQDPPDRGTAVDTAQGKANASRSVVAIPQEDVGTAVSRDHAVLLAGLDSEAQSATSASHHGDVTASVGCEEATATGEGPRKRAAKTKTNKGPEKEVKMKRKRKKKGDEFDDLFSSLL